jgi:hypothetical protein
MSAATSIFPARRTPAVVGSAAPAAAAPQAEATTERQRAEFWLNIGYDVEVPYEDGRTDTQFISLPVGVALDTMKKVPVNGSPVFAAQSAAKNNLLDVLMAHASGMAPGTAQVLNLKVQIRRVKDENADNSPKPGENPFIVPLTLVG